MTDPNKTLPGKIVLNPSTLLAPVPVVLVSCQGTGSVCPDAEGSPAEGSPAEGEGGSRNPGEEIQAFASDRPNLITLAWAGTICSDPPMVSISIRPSRLSHQLVKESGEFVINLVNEPLLKATDFCGVRSGRDVDKFEACNLHPMPIDGMTVTPAVAESPLSLACKVRSVHSLGSHDVFLAEIVTVIADQTLMDPNGKLNLNKAGLVAYTHGEYRALGRVLGFFGYSVASPEVLARRMPVKPRRRRKT